MKVRRQKSGDGNQAGGVWPVARQNRNGARPGCICALLAVLVLAVLSPARAQDHEIGEYRVKLAFLYNFAQFVEWPADSFRDSKAPLTICVAGDNPFEGEIGQSLQGRAVGGHPIELRKLRPEEDPRTCHIVFVRT